MLLLQCRCSIFFCISRMLRRVTDYERIGSMLSPALTNQFRGECMSGNIRTRLTLEERVSRVFLSLSLDSEKPQPPTLIVAVYHSMMSILSKSFDYSKSFDHLLPIRVS